MYRLRVFSPNNSCDPLRATFLNRKVALRLGSSKEHILPEYLVLNSQEGIRISSDKRRSKQAMDECGISHAEWIIPTSYDDLLEFFNTYVVIIIKKYNSSKGNNIYYIDTIDKLNHWYAQHYTELNSFVVEKYYNYNREYRFHVDVNHGIFYMCRKLLRNDAEETWHRHDSNSVWILPTNPKFKCPSFLQSIESDCKKYMRYIGLDICAFDVKSNDHSYIILESNTAPCLGSVGITMYQNHFYKYYNENI